MFHEIFAKKYLTWHEAVYAAIKAKLWTRVVVVKEGDFYVIYEKAN